MANLFENTIMKIFSSFNTTGGSNDAFRLAFDDPQFMHRDQLMGIRLQLELLKPELAQVEAGIKHTVVVFGSTRFKSLEHAKAQLTKAESSNDAAMVSIARTEVRNSHYYEAARRFARLVAEQFADSPIDERLTICTGGGPGIMEAANRGAKEAGAVSVALNIALPREQAPNPYVTEHLSFQFHYFAIRKMHFMMRAKALVAFPGGFGTFDELFEILTLVQTHKAQKVPVLLYGSDYWKKVINFGLMLEERTISAEDAAFFQFVDTPEDALALIKS